MEYINVYNCSMDYIYYLELEKLNTETAEINKLELELEESNTTFRMLLNEATRRLKCLAQRLGNSVERARPYHEAYAAAQDARAACQRAAVAYRHASEIHAAAKETVTLAEQRFKSNQHEWQFDNAWQEMLNHATIKVMDAENKKSDSGREHHKRAQLFNLAETKLQQLEEQLRRHVIKSRPYFDEKQLCQEQLNTQKERIEYLQSLITKAKFRYSQSLKTLESISEEIHMKRGDMYGDAIGECPVGPREPGVGAENYSDYSLELEQHDLGLKSVPLEIDDMNEETKTLEELRRRVRRLAARPVEGGASGDIAWETELNETVNQLDQMLMIREKAQQAKNKTISYNPSSSSPSQFGPKNLLNEISKHIDEVSTSSSSPTLDITQNTLSSPSIMIPDTASVETTLLTNFDKLSSQVSLLVSDNKVLDSHKSIFSSNPPSESSYFVPISDIASLNLVENNSTELNTESSPSSNTDNVVKKIYVQNDESNDSTTGLNNLTPIDNSSVNVNLHDTVDILENTHETQLLPIKIDASQSNQTSEL